MDSSNLHTISEKILSSKRFKGNREGELLDYLVKCSLEGRIPKETTIAIEVFNRDERYHPADDSIVRSSIYALRKKLEAYYLDEGRGEQERIHIPKGGYRVVVSRQESESGSRKKTAVLPWILSGILAVVAIVLGVMVLQSPSGGAGGPMANDHPVWGSFVESGIPVLIVLGDSYFIEKENSDSTFSYLYDLRISSDEEFRKAIAGESLPPDWRKGYGHLFLGSEMPAIAMNLFHVFRDTRLEVKIRLASQLTPQEIESHNIVYVGGYKNMHVLDHFFFRSHYVLSENLSYLEYKGHAGELQLVDLGGYYGDNDRREYVLVSKMKTGKGTEILFVMSKLAFGKSEIVRLLTGPGDDPGLEGIGEKPYWEILYRVRGLESTGFSRRQVQLDYLD